MRWRIVGLLFAFSVIGYIERVNISIAGELMMREFGMNPVQLGSIFTAFLIPYTGFQTPGGAWADRFGPRLVLGAAGVAWGLLTILTAVLPGLVFRTAISILVSLWVVRILLGVCEAPTYPTAARSLANWVPRSQRGFCLGFVISGALFGTAITSPLVASLMVHLGWRTALILVSLLGPAVSLLWLIASTDHPREHPRVNRAELETIGATGDGSTKVARPRQSWITILKSGQAWILFFAYGCHNYLSYVFIFWSYHYLIEVRHFSLAGGGVAAAMPFILSTVTTPAAGASSDWLTLRFGHRFGRSVIPVIALPSAAVCVGAGIQVNDPHLAVLLLSVGYALGLSPEGPCWASMMEIAGPVAGTAGGFLNTGGNFVGAIAVFLSPWIARGLGWKGAFGVSCVLAVVGSILWLMVDPTRRIRMAQPAPISNPDPAEIA